MKKFFSLPAIIALTLSLAAFSCGSNNKDNSADNNDKITKLIAKSDSASVAGLPNFRYVDLDTVLSKYNLAKDYNEEMLRMQNKLQTEAKRQEGTLQSKATTIQNKMQNNGYLSQESFDADQKELADMQNKAQKAMASMQNNFETTALAAQKTVNDSIEAYIQEYNKKKGYDAIFFKAATIYVNPALDITEEVVAGLNARYNKVK